jgi:hypothetical protein
MKKIISFFCLFYCCNSIAQTDLEKWEKADCSYAQKIKQVGRDYSIEADNISQFIVNSFTSAYWFFISDVDGDNCPFEPTCSRFFVEAVKETNLPQGVLMFFDRFTRDINVYDRLKKYPHLGAATYYDPVTLYTLEEKKIKYLPPYTSIKSE